MKKQSWEKTFREINTFNESYKEALARHQKELEISSVSGAMRIADRLTQLANRRREHIKAIRQAIKEGKTIPASVLISYPNLVKNVFFYSSKYSVFSTLFFADYLTLLIETKICFLNLIHYLCRVVKRITANNHNQKINFYE